MGWSIGYDPDWKRDIGYGVSCLCDHPGCNEEIDRGIGYVCGSEPYGGEYGCGLYFCRYHLITGEVCDDHPAEGEFIQFCERCAHNKDPFEPKPDFKKWIEWKLKDKSWQQWRDENPEKVAKMKEQIGIKL